MHVTYSAAHVDPINNPLSGAKCNECRTDPVLKVTAAFPIALYFCCKCIKKATSADYPWRFSACAWPGVEDVRSAGHRMVVCKEAQLTAESKTNNHNLASNWEPQQIQYWNQDPADRVVAPFLSNRFAVWSLGNCETSQLHWMQLGKTSAYLISVSIHCPTFPGTKAKNS